ncbi:MAG: NAD(P)-dependent oxidoreductase [Armatimonadetes bacterium]|nr:NAD(P)-dependent oxidoreductase [Armatimonadota bacterium]
MTIGFVGLGVMGGPMAGHLAAKGMKTLVWNRTPEKGAWPVSQGAAQVDSLQELASQSDVVCICVSRSEDVADVVRQMEPHAKANTLFIDHSTIAPEAAIQIHNHLQTQGHRFLDAPITGGSMGAQKGTLTIFVGGDQSDFDQAKPILDCYARRAELVGEPGAGQKMKLANQIGVVGALLGLCESLTFAKKAGLDLAQTRDMLASGAAGSWAFENYGPKILNHDWTPGFSIINQAKDLVYALEAAQQMGAFAPTTELANKLLQQMIEEGHGEWTTAALYDKMLQLGFGA